MGEEKSLQSLRESVSTWFDEGEERRFICDEMLEGLAKQLRSCGIDCQMVTNALTTGGGESSRGRMIPIKGVIPDLVADKVPMVDGKGKSASKDWLRKEKERAREKQRHIRELLTRELVESHDREGRVILTADKRLAGRGLAE